MSSDQASRLRTMALGQRPETPLFAARMVEQVCQIEHYRQQVQRAEGRVLDAETAAREWIKRYAASFPALGKGSTH